MKNLILTLYEMLWHWCQRHLPLVCQHHEFWMQKTWDMQALYAECRTCGKEWIIPKEVILQDMLEMYGAEETLQRLES